jgi:hypothetical protein
MDTTHLAATIETPAGREGGGTLDLVLRITNTGENSIALLNPDIGVPSPEMKWPYSKEMYRTSMLISYGYLSISITDANGEEIPQRSISTWATPVLQPKLELAPGRSIELMIPIGELYALEPGCEYEVAIEYGDRESRVAARARIPIG